MEHPVAGDEGRKGASEHLASDYVWSRVFHFCSSDGALTFILCGSGLAPFVVAGIGASLAVLLAAIAQFSLSRQGHRKNLVFQLLSSYK